MRPRPTTFYLLKLRFSFAPLTCLSPYLSDEAKSLAQSIYMKKKMYYNMRMKTLKRNATNVAQEAHEIFKQKLSSVNVTLNMLLKKKKDVEGFLEINQYKIIEEAEQEEQERDREREREGKGRREKDEILAEGEFLI